MRSETIAILGALALHGVVLIVGRGMKPSYALAPDVVAAKRDATEYDIEPALIEESRATTPLPDNVAPERPLDPVHPEARTAVGARTSPLTPTPMNPTGPSTAEPTSGAPTPANPGGPPSPGQDTPNKWDSLPPDRQDGVYGVPGSPGGPPIWAIPGVVHTERGPSAPAPTTTPEARQVDPRIGDRVLEDTMAARDKKLGLDLPAAGTVSSAVATAVQSSDVPNDAKGTIAITLGPNGNIVDVRVLGTVGGTPDQWARVAAAARAALAGRGLILTEQYAKGATVTVNVSSNLQAPSGSKGGFQGTGVAFDTSNIGAHSTRHVRTSFSVSAVR